MLLQKGPLMVIEREGNSVFSTGEVVVCLDWQWQRCKFQKASNFIAALLLQMFEGGAKQA